MIWILLGDDSPVWFHIHVSCGYSSCVSLRWLGVFSPIFCRPLILRSISCSRRRRLRSTRNCILNGRWLQDHFPYFRVCLARQWLHDHACSLWWFWGFSHVFLREGGRGPRILIFTLGNIATRRALRIWQPCSVSSLQELFSEMDSSGRGLQVFISTCSVFPAATCLVAGSPEEYVFWIFRYVSIFSALLGSTADTVHTSVAFTQSST